MDRSELDRQIAEVLEKGFDDSFAVFCATTFSSYDYPPGNLAFARMHAFYLREALEMLSSAETRDTLSVDAEGKTLLEKAFREVTTKSYQAALCEDRPFCEVFVQMWCSWWADVRIS